MLFRHIGERPLAVGFAAAVQRQFSVTPCLLLVANTDSWGGAEPLLGKQS